MPVIDPDVMDVAMDAAVIGLKQSLRDVRRRLEIVVGILMISSLGGYFSADILAIMHEQVFTAVWPAWLLVAGRMATDFLKAISIELLGASLFFGTVDILIRQIDKPDSEPQVSPLRNQIREIEATSRQAAKSSEELQQHILELKNDVARLTALVEEQ